MYDYSAHKLNARKHLKKSDSLLLENKYDEAMEQIDEAIVELRMTKAAITNKKEEHETRTRA